MFDIGWTELLLIGIVALIVVGPKDLPQMFRTLGQLTAKARGMAREFQRAMDDAADQTGVKNVARDLRQMTDPKNMGLDELNKMKNWDPLRDDPKSAPGKPAPAPTPSDEDEFDRIEAEMAALSTVRDRKSDVPVADPTHEASEPMTRPESRS